TVKSGQVICEIETDKATMEVEAVDEGKVGQLVVPEGAEGVKVNAVIAVLLEEGEASVPAGAAAALSPPQQAAAPAATKPAPAPAQPTPQPTKPGAPAPQPAAVSSGQRIFVSP